MIRVWDPHSGALLAELTARLDGQTVSIDIAPDGTWLTVAGGGAIEIWDVRTKQCRLRFGGHSDFRQVAAGPDGAWLMTCGGDGSIRMWDTSTGHALGELPRVHGWVATMALAPSGDCLAVVGEDRTISVWDPARRILLNTLNGASHRVSAAAIASDGQFLAAVGQDRTVKIWSIAQARAVAMTRIDQPAFGCAWRSGQPTLFVGGSAGLYRFDLRFPSRRRIVDGGSVLEEGGPAIIIAE